MSSLNGTTALSILTPWYPVPYNRMAGSFVAEHARICSALVDGGGAEPPAESGRVQVVHALEWPGGTPEAAKTLQPAFETVLDRMRANHGTRISGIAGAVERVPVFTIGGAQWADRAEASVREVRRALGSVDATVLHGHVGYLGGVMAARLADPAARVFATEHSTQLRQVLAEPQARDLYAEVIDRAQAVYCVSEVLRAQILDVLPDPHGRVQVMDNPVDFIGAPHRDTPVTALQRWVFVGGLIERKGVRRLVQAFTIAAAQDSQVSLTMYGDGPLREELISLAAQAGVGDRLHLPGVLRHRDLLAALPGFDLLMAPSTYETFHLAVPEAVAAGLAVIVTRSGGPQEALAGVQDQVGTFVEVADTPDELVDAWQELSRNLDRLDLDAARATLTARYGREAIAARLAQAYGFAPPPAGPLAPAVAGAARPVPQRLVVAAASGWRIYHVEAELDAVRKLAVPTVVVSQDAAVLDRAQGLPTITPSAATTAAGAKVGAASSGTRSGDDATGAGGASATTGATGAAGAASGTTGAAGAALSEAAQRLESAMPGLRRTAGAFVRRARGQAPAKPAPVPAAASAVATAQARGFPFDLDGATLLVVDCQSMPLAQSLLAHHPGLLPVVELDRSGVLAPSADSQVQE